MIRTEQLTIGYGAKTAVSNATLAFPPGTITAIVGPSGCGKSSFLASLNRMLDLIPSARVSGRVWLDETDIYEGKVDLAILRRRVGMIFQKPNPFPMSILKNIQLALQEHGVGSERRREITENVLKDVGLWEEVKDRFSDSALQLSGGQQQRLCIARAIALEPEVLLMDEPCSALDPKSSAVVEALIRRLQGRYTIVIVTHNLAQARRIADNLAVFWVRDGAGEIIESGPVAEIFANPQQEITANYLAGFTG